ncbi:hemagglutinin repeat-containing protein [Enterobacter nematophilus]|nr:hemagglutinin repeat-containing protein [Enterobacter nematophilus]MDO2440947.1 hemagglutinin repeat-containing protein [Enterobacter nematophilus]
MDKHPVGLAKRLISYLVMFLVAGQPVFPAVAASINPVTPGTRMDQAGNGVPVINIATPNQAGISHNQFQDYNVGKEGLILNNGTDRLTQTQLGGLIQNNPNLQAGREAKGIINEVTGASRSQLQGYTEVAGKAANVMVANPYGITCNGCGFINTPNATLTTGKPQFDANGNLLALDVTKGAITVEGQGLDASRSDALSIIARATEVNAAIHAKDLTVTVGANRVATDGSVTPVVGEGVAPQVSVDTGALGGMYANRIHLVSSEKGVGVNLGDLNARQGDITLDTNGKLMVNNSLASGSLTAKADSVVLSGEHKSTGTMQINSRSDVAVTNGKLVSDGDITLAGNGKLSVANGTLTAGKDINLSSGSLTADTTSEVNAAGAIQANVAGAADHAGKMVAGSGISLSAGQLANSGKMTANGDLNVKAGGFTNSGAVQAQKNTRLDLGTLNHTGQLLTGGVLGISTGDARIDGMLSSDSDLSVSGTGALNIGQNGQLLSAGRLGLQSDSVINNGLVSGKQNLALTSRQFSAVQGSTLTSGGSLQLNAGDAQIAGEVLAQGGLSFSGDRITTLSSGQLQSQGDMLLQAHNAAGLDGVQAAKGNLTLATGSLTHRGTSRGSNVSLQANQIDTSGTLQADNAMALSAETIVQQAGGALLAQKALQINASQLTNGGSLDSDALTIAINGHTDNHASGKMTARNGLTLTGNTFTNDGQLAASTLALTLNNAFTNTASGSVLAENTLDLTAPVFNNAGRVASSALNLSANTLDNSGLLQGGQTLRLASERLANQSGGKIISGSGLTLNIPQLVNAGLISVKQGLTIESLMLTNSGNLEAQSMALKAGQKSSNQQGGVMLAEASLALTTPAFDNAGSVQGKTLTIDAGEWSNGGQASGLDDLSVNVRDTFTNLADGRLVSQQSGSVNAGQFANFGGVTAGNLRISGNSLTNDGWLQSGGALDLNVGALANRLSGTLQAGSGLAVTVQQLVNAGAISAQQGAALDALTLDNNGRIEAQDLQLTLREKLNNLAEGILLAQRSLKLATPLLSNDGRLMSESATLNAKTLVNKGLLQGSAALVADGEEFNNASEGEVVSGGTLTFNESQGFSNAGKVQGETIGLNTRRADNSGQMLGLSALSLSGTESLTNSGNLLSKGKLGLTSEQLDNQGQIAAPELNINTRQMTNSGLLQGDQLFGFTASSLHNQKQGSIISGSGLRLAIPDLVNAGLISVTQGLAIEAATLDNAGNIEAKDLQLTLRQQLNNQAKGVLLADDTLHLSTPVFTNQGQLISRSGTLIADTLSNAGLLQGNQGLSVSSLTLDNLSGGQLLSGGALTLNSVLGKNAGRLQGDTVQVSVGRLDNSGQVLAVNGLSLTAGELNNTAGAEMSGSGGSLHVDQLVNAGLISVSQGLAIDALTLTNGGNIEAGNLALTSVQTLNNQASGVLLADDTLSIDAASGDNAGKLISSNARLAVSSLTNSGLIQGNQSLGLQSSQLNNIASGQLLSDGDVGLNVDRLDNAGRVQGKSLTLAGGQSGGVNRGQMLGREALNILFAGAFNNDGRLISQNSLSLKSGALSNTGVIAAATVNIDSAVGQANNSGLIQADGKLSFSAASLSNQKSGSLVAGDDIALTVPALVNDGLMSTGKNLRLDGTSLDNRGGLEALNVQLNLSGQVNNQPEGHLFADDLLTLNAGSWRNDGQLIGNNVIISSGHGQNSGLLQGDTGLKLAVTGLDNDRAGKIVSGGLLDITGQQLNNNGLMQGQNALLHGVDFTNAGSLTGKGDLTLNVDNTATISGQMLSQGKLQLDANQLVNSGILAANTVSVSTGELNNTGTLQSNGALNLVADAFSNVGTLLAKQALNLTSAMLTNSGVIQADTLTLAVKNALTNRDTGKVLATQALAFDGNTLTNSGTLAADNARLALGILNNSGLVQGNSGLAIQGQAAQTSGLRSVDAAQTPAAKVINNLIVGQLLSGGDLTIAGDKGDNAGTLQGRTLNVKAGSWNNEGTLLGQQGASLNVSSTLTNSGTLLSEAGFDIRAGAVDNRGQLAAGTLNLQSDSISNSGLLQGSAALTFDTRALDNLTGGQILSGGSLNLDLPQFTNGGLVQASQDMTLTTGSFDNLGTLSAGALNLNVAQQLNNQSGGKLLATRQLSSQSASLTNNGVLAAMSVELTSGQIDNNGILQGDSALALHTPRLNNLTNGQIVSGSSLNLSIPQMVNLGLMSVKEALVLSGATLDNQGTLQGSRVGLSFTGDVVNRGNARLVAQKDLTLSAASLNNQGTLAGDSVNIITNLLTNVGLLQGNSALALNSLTPSTLVLNNKTGGQIITGGALTLSLPQLTNQGLLLSQQGLTLNLDNLDNQGIVQARDLGLNIGNQLTNQQSGRLLAQQGLNLTAARLDNAGQLAASNATLAVNILNNRGVLQGDGGLSITGPTLNNLTGGKLLTGGQLTFKAGQLVNAGIMQGQRLGVNASGWNNSGSALGTDGLTAQVDNQLTNTGRLLGQGSTRVAAGALNNQGSLLVDGDLIVDGGSLSNGGSLQGSTLTVNSGTVDNAGSVIGLNALTLQPLQGLTNRAGASMKTQGTLLAGGQSITNDGLWQSQYLKVNARQLQNNGTLQSAGNMDLALTSSLVNTGSMVANGTATLGAPTLKNQGQMLAKKMSLSGGSLSNSGSISGADGLGVTLSGDLDQQAGAKLLSNGLLSMGANILTNLGHIQGSTLTLNAGSLNNQGRMEANTALNATLRGNVDNGRNAVMLSQGTFQLGAQTLNNDGTLQGNGNTQLDLRDRGSNQGQLLSGATLTLNTPGLTNSGWVQGFALWLNAGSLNNSGTVLAQQQGTLGGNYIVNNGMLQGANLTVNPGQLDNNGTVYATQNLGIAASQVNNAAAARMLSQGNLAINATNTGLQGQVVALGDLSLASKASYNQLTTLAAGNTLSVTSQGDITTNGLMQGKGIQLSAAGTLNNNGQLRAGYGESQLSAGQLNLNGTGSVEAGGTLRLSSLNGINNAGFVGTAGDLIASAGSTLLNSALLYAGNNMSLLANSIRNARGDILAGNSLWMQRDSAGNASAEVVNTSGNIETQRGDISILTGHLVNERDGLNAVQSETNIAPSWVKGGTADIPVDWISSSGTGKYGIYVTEGQRYHGHGDDWSEMLGNYAPYEDADVQKVAVKTVSVSVSAKGQQSRIASGRDIIARSDNVENMASSILANRNIQLSGSTLNNQSWLNGTSTVYNVYRYGVGDKYARRPDETTRSYDKLVSKSISYVLDSVTTEGASGDVYRAVIQAGGAVVASFSNNISNTSTTANAPGYKPGLSAPGLNLSGGPTVAAGAKATGLGAASSQSVAAPQATINLPGGGSGIGNAEALTSRNAGNNGLASIDNRPQSIGDFGQAGGKLADVHLQAAGLTSQNGANGTPVDLTGTGAALVVPGSSGGKHTTIASDAVALAGQKQSGTSGTSALASRDKIGEIAAVTAQIISLSSGGKTPPPPGYNYRPVSLTDISSVAPALTSNGSPIKLSDYPLPANNNGYFVANRDPKSPYLIVTNPKLAGLGQLDSSLFNDLYKLAGTTPPSAPQETRTTYTDTTQFLGSDYFLARLNLRPEYDYRFLGDAAFDTRYVSNQILNETGSRYVNGVGSDLEQMQYLIDRAAQARDKLGLQLGVSLSEEQVASLDSSILWWENMVIEGQNVLVPRLYLSAKDVAFNKGSIIAGNQVILNAGSITNDGSTLQGKSLLAASSQSTINNINGGLIGSSGSLQLSALGNINNVGSTISGQTVSLESVGGSIVNQTLTNQWNISGVTNGWNSQAVSLTQTDLGALASIKATDSLTLSAGKDIINTGANLSAGGDMLLKALDDISVTGNQLVTRDRNGRNLNETVTNQGSTVTSGGNLGLQAGHDLNVTGSNLTAGGSAALWAGNDLVLDVAQNSRHSQTAKTDSLKTDNTRTVISAGDDLTLAAGRDLRSNAAALAAQDRVGLQAGRDIDLLAAETTTSDKYSAKKKVEINQSVRQQGTEIASGSSTTIIANRDVNTQAAQVTAHGDIGVGAGRDINLATATDSDYHYKEQTKTKKGFLSKKTTHTIEENSATRESGSLLSGDNVQVVAGNNLRVSGSAVAGDGDVQLKAGNNVDIVAATNTDTSWRFKEEKKSGLMGSGGIGFTIGSSKSTQDLREKGTTQSQSFSTVGSTGGSVDIAAGNQLHVGGADLVAGKDMALTGDSVAIEPGHDRLTSDQTFKQKSSGLTIALSGAVGDAVNAAASTAMAVKEQSDGRLAALQATKAALSGAQAVQANRLAEVTHGSDPTRNGAFGVMASIGGQSSKSTSHSEQDKTTGSTLNAGNNLAITATGQGHAANSGDITVAGSQLKAGKDLTLNAAQDISLAGAADTNKLTGSNSSKGGSVGIGITAGPKGAGITLSASVNAAKGKEKGNGTSWNETTLDAGQTVSLTSGRDTVLKGAQVNGDKITADVGRDLTLSSLQDSDKYNSKQQNMNAGASYTWGAGGGSGSFSISRDKMKSNYDSVQEQTGIFAGKGGFDINVGNHTQLDGAVIASRADADKNRLETATLGFADINNKAEYKVEHQGVGFSTGVGVAGNLVGNMANTLLAGMGSSGNAEGTTQSAVADGAIIVRDQSNQKQDVSTLSRDTDHANGSIDPIFNKEKEQKRLQTAQMIGEIGNQVADIAHTNGKIAATEAANEKMKTAGGDERNAAISQLKKDGKEVTDQAIHDQMYQTFYNEAFNKSGMGTGQSTQRAITAATAAVQALAGGDIKAAIGGGAAPYIANAIANAIPETDLKGRVLAHAVVNAALAAASGRDAASAAAGAAVGELAGKIAVDGFGKKVSELSEEEKQTVSALATLASGLAGGLVGDSSANAVASAQAGKTTVENNSLSAQDEKKRQDAKWSLPYIKDATEKAKAEKLIADLNAKDKAFDVALDKACQGLSSSACQGMRQELAVMGQSYDEQMDGQYVGTMGSVYKDGAEKIAGQQWQYATADAKAQRDASVELIGKNWGVSPETAAILYDGMTAVHSTAAVAGSLYGMRGPSTVTVYRVEGTPNTRLLIGDNGQVTITGSTTLYLNFGDKARAIAFFEKRSIQNMDDATIKTFEVPNSVLDDLRRTAVKESVARLPENKGKPVIADPTKAKDQYGIRPEKLKELQDKIIPGTGKDASK